MPNNNFQQTVYLQSGLPQTENRPADAYSGGQLGSRFTVVDPADANKAKRYQLVQNDSAMDAVPFAGAVAFWRDATGYTVTTDVSFGGRGNPAGIYLLAVTLGNICCIQQKGPCSVKGVDSPTSAPDTSGKIVIPSATDGKADVLGAGSSATYPPLGVAVGTQDATSKLFTVELDLEGRE